MLRVVQGQHCQVLFHYDSDIDNRGQFLSQPVRVGGCVQT